MNKRLFGLYAVVFILIGVMLYLYRTSYHDMKTHMGEVDRISSVIIRLKKLDGYLQVWLKSDSVKQVHADFLMPAGTAYDSILVNIENLKALALLQEERLRLDSLKKNVKEYQRITETGKLAMDSLERNAHLGNVRKLAADATLFAENQLRLRKEKLEDSTSLLDQWLTWMLLFAASLITVATFYSFLFLRRQQQTEGFNTTLLKATNNGIISFSPVRDDREVIDYAVTYANAAALKLLHADDIGFRTLSTLIHPKVHPAVRRAFDEVLTERLNRTLEGYIERQQERQWLQATIAPLHDGIMVSLYDLTPVKMYEQRLTHQITQLEMLNEELKQYAYITSHDLQEPLRKIQMFTDLGLNMKEGSGRTKDELFGKIFHTATHMRDLIQTLLLFTRTTHNPEQFAPVDLNDVLTEVITEHDAVIARANARIRVGELPVVNGSRVHLVLLFSNLISNAMKYAKPGSPPIIEVSHRLVSQQELHQFPELNPLVRYHCITVEDEGVGFPQHLAEKMFTIFQRLHNKEQAGGNGIGLAICRKIVHQHEGFIYARGVENEGAAIYIFLPATKTAGT